MQSSLSSLPSAEFLPASQFEQYVDASIAEYVSRGHWEGETLVIETTNFRGDAALTGPNMHLVERLTRRDPDTVTYEYTVTDPTVYTAPYTVMLPLRRTDGPKRPTSEINLLTI